MSILAFAGSNSANSINHALVSYVAGLLPEGSAEVIRLTDYDSPMYQIDVEEKSGIPSTVVALNDKIASADKLIISLAEHNGSPTAFFKNLIDWLSRHQRDFLKGKKVLLLSTSPGQAGGGNALATAKTMLPFFGAEIVDSYSVGGFYDKFSDGQITDAETAQTLKEKVQAFAS